MTAKLLLECDLLFTNGLTVNTAQLKDIIHMKNSISKSLRQSLPEVHFRLQVKNAISYKCVQKQSLNIWSYFKLKQSEMNGGLINNI